jgi:putative peptidoglycan lipid II flippase
MNQYIGGPREESNLFVSPGFNLPGACAKSGGGLKLMTQTTTLKKIGFASFIMMASVFASRIIGLARESAIAWVGGASFYTDAYQVAFIIPEILNHVVASGFLSITFIPIFTRYISKGEETKGFKVFSNIFNCFGLLLLGLILISMVFAPSLVRILAPGMADGPGFDLAVEMTRIIVPAQFFFFSGGLFMAVQFTREKFFIPAMAPLIYNAGIILGGVILEPVMGIKGFAWGVLGGAFAGNFALQLFGAYRCGLRYYPLFNPRHREFIRYLALTLPLMLGLTMTFSTEILMKFFGSFLAEGSIAAMNFAIRIMFILVGFFGQAVGQASFPYMARLAADQDMDQLNHVINQTLKFILLVLPFSVLFMVVRQEVVFILFQRGAFDATDAALTAGVLPWFLAGAFAFSAQTIVSRGFFSVQNTLFPALFSSLCVILSLPLIYTGMHFFGIHGVAFTLSLSVVLTTGLLYEAWNRKSKNTGKKQVYLFFMKLAGLSLVSGLILEILHRWLVRLIVPDHLGPALMICIIMGLVFCAGILVMGQVMNIQEIRILFKKLQARIWPWANKTN